MFDKSYTQYWEDSISKSIDGSVVPGLATADKFVQLLSIKKETKVLDIGCSFGRMFDVLSQYTDNVFGLEYEQSAVELAKQKNFQSVHQGKAESTPYTDEFFDTLFCWAVFEAVEHFSGLNEFNRILKQNGKLLFTGKSDNYPDDDNLGLLAEKNAFVKGFPNRFTNLPNLLLYLNEFGFTTESLFLFPKRGDFGLLNFQEFTTFDDLDNIFSYEYLIICNKTGPTQASKNINYNLENEHTLTANRLAKKNKFGDVISFFHRN
jgi:SAM-dependent methyltransferase